MCFFFFPLSLQHCHTPLGFRVKLLGAAASPAVGMGQDLAGHTTALLQEGTWRAAGAGRGSGSEELGLCGFPLPAALCRTCSGGCRTALQAGAHLQPCSEGWCLGRESVGQSPKRAQEVIGSRTGARNQNLQPPPHPWCPPSSHPTLLLLPRPGARWAEAPSEAQARDNC